MINNVLLPETDLGRPLYCTHALWAGVLRNWQRIRNDFEPWDDIVFDKLAHLVHLLWNALHREGVVSFKSAYFSAPGIHGPGPALRKNDRYLTPIHAIKVINDIQESLSDFKNPDIYIFAIEPKKKFAGRERFQISPGREWTYFPIHLSDSLPQAFRTSDYVYLKSISEALSKLDKDEIRSLGTHQTKKGTLDAVEYNIFVHLPRRVVGLLYKLKNNSNSNAERLTHREGYSLPSVKAVLDEIKRKTCANRHYYESGLRKLKDQIDTSNKALRISVDQFEEASIIWDSQEMNRWHEIGTSLYNLLPYLSRLKVFLQTGSSSGKCETLRAHEEEARNNISQMFGIDLPPITSFNDNIQIWQAFLKKILDIFDNLPHISNNYKQNYENFKEALFAGHINYMRL